MKRPTKQFGFTKKRLYQGHGLNTTPRPAETLEQRRQRRQRFAATLTDYARKLIRQGAVRFD